MQNISYRRLIYFAEAVRAGSMRAASDALNIAPSSISRQIAALEDEVGFPLIEKGRRNIKLTQAGHIVLEHFRERRAHEEAFQSRLRNLHGLKEGEINVAVGEGFISGAMGEILNQFTVNYPGIRVGAYVANSNEIVRQVLEDEVHFGMVFQTPHDSKIHVRWTKELLIKVVVSASHALAKAKSLRLSDLKDYPLGLVKPGFRIRQVISEAETAEGVFLSPVLTTDSLFLLRRFVAAGHGITILPENVMHREVEAGIVKCIPIDNDAIRPPTVHIITRAGRQLPQIVLLFIQRLESSKLI